MHGFIASFGLLIFFIFISSLIMRKYLMRCKTEWKILFIVISISTEITILVTDFPCKYINNHCHISSDFSVFIYISSILIVVPLIMYGLSKLVCLKSNKTS